MTKSRWKKFLILNNVNDDKLNKRIIDMLENNAIPDDADVVIFCQGIESESKEPESKEMKYRVLEYQTVFDLIRNRIIAIAYSKDLVKDAGSLNKKLQVMAEFELACRLAEYAKGCVLVVDPNAERSVSTVDDVLEFGGVSVSDNTVVVMAESEEADAAAEAEAQLAYTCAYVIRYHLKHLTSLGLMDSVFQQFCAYMQEKGVFSLFQQAMNRFLSDETKYERIAGQTAPFVVLRGDDTCGGVLQNFADDLSAELTELGQAVIEVDDTFTEHERIQNACVKGVVGFQAKALEIDFFKNMKGPKFQFWFDYPLHFDNVLRNLPDDYYILCQDADYAKLIRTYLHTENALQFPPGGIDGGYSKEKMRPYDIVFIGNYFEEDVKEFTEKEKHYYEYMLAHPQLTLEQGLTDIMAAAGMKIGDADSGQVSFPEEMYAMKRVRRAVIAYYREKVIESILETGYCVHVYGESWRGYQGKGRKNLVIHRQVTVRESLAELGKAKIGLNVMSWHKSGMTERVANILLSGAVCLTEETGYIREHFIDGKELVCFSLTCLEELPEKIKVLLEQPGLREEIAQRGYLKAQKEHTWHCRAGQLIELAECYRAEQSMVREKTTQGRLVLFRGELDTVNLFSDQLKQGFLELGYDIFEFDLQESTKSLGLLYQYMQEAPITAMIAFNSQFFGMTLPSGGNMWEALGIPCINIFVDHPYWYHNILMRMPATGIVLCIDRNHMNYVDRFYSNIPSNGFLAHGGTALCPNCKPMTERKIDVLYAGSLYADHIPKVDLSGWKFPAEQICESSIKRLLEHPEKTIETVIEQELHKAGINLSDDELRRFISSCVHVERVVSSHYRERIVGSVAKAGISLELYGEGWSGCDWIKLPNVHYGGRVTPEEILSMMEDSKIVLNTLPWFKDGSHERVFNAMLCGAVAVSETSGYLEETLPPDAWVSFDLSEKSLSALPQRIVALLSDEARLQEIAFRGHGLAAAEHTWKARAQELHRDLLSFL